MIKRFTVAVVVSAHNEEKVISKTLASLQSDIHRKDIFIVSDASGDNTDKICKKFGVNLLRNKRNIGKINSLKKAIKHFKILTKYKYVLVLDADTYPKANFFNLILSRFEKNKNTAVVCGQVMSQEKANIFVVYRSVMYFIWQNIYKRLSSTVNAVMIAPGTSSIYKSSVLAKIEFDKDIIIEDFDMTFQIHRKKLGSIVYEPKAEVVTQDPDNFFDYFKQCTRWQLGFFQTVKKHKVPFKFQAFDIAIILFFTIDLVHSIYLFFLMALFLYSLFPGSHSNFLSFLIDRKIVFYLISIDFLLLWGFAAIQNFWIKKFYLIFFGPFLWFVQFVSIASLIKGFYQSMFLKISGPWVSPTRR